MGVLQLIIMVALIGLFVCAITTLVPMPAQFKRAIKVIIIVALVLYILQGFGLLSGFHGLRIGR